MKVECDDAQAKATPLIQFLVEEIEPYTQKESLCEKIEEKVLDATITEFGGFAMEDLKELKLVLPITFSYICGFIIAFVVLMNQNIQALLSQQFLSLTQDQGGAAICESVPLPVTGTFLGSTEGYWETNQKFNYNSSIFRLQFASSSMSNEKYTNTMLKFKSQLETIGSKAKNRSVLFNYLVLSTFRLYDADAAMMLSTTADPGIYFDSVVQTAAFSSSDGAVCNPYGTTGRETNGYFDKATKRLVMEFPLNFSKAAIEDVGELNGQTNFGNFDGSYFSSGSYADTCPMNIDKSAFGGGAYAASLIKTLAVPSFPEYRGGINKFSFDVRSIVLAVSLNLGLTTTDKLLKVETIFLSEGDNMAYIDPIVDPPMDPVVCNKKAKGDTGPDVCFLVFYKSTFIVLVYPILSQLKTQDGVPGGSITSPRLSQCLCPHDALESYCNTNDFYIGILQGHSILDLAQRVRKIIIDDPVNGDVTAMTLFSHVLGYTANAAFAANENDIKIVSQGTVDNSWANGMSWNELLADAYADLCPDCVGWVFETHGAEGTSNVALSLNRYLVRLSQFSASNVTIYNKYSGAFVSQQNCVDSISQSEAMGELAKVAYPPKSYVSAHFSLHMLSQNSLF